MQAQSFVAMLVRVVLGIGIYGLFLFVPAGTLDWPSGWLLVAILAYAALGELIVLRVRNPALLAERGRSLADDSFQPWDRRLTVAAGAMFVAVLVASGLDHRLGWTPAVPVWLIALATFLAVCGHTLFLWAMTSNTTFFRGVRVDRAGHGVASDGPYRAVRHPGYLGAIVAHVAQPIGAGSLVGLRPATVTAVLMIRRTQLEDRFLMSDLSGYAAFATRTRYRLLPFVW